MRCNKAQQQNGVEGKHAGQQATGPITHSGTKTSTELCAELVIPHFGDPNKCFQHVKKHKSLPGIPNNEGALASCPSSSQPNHIGTRCTGRITRPTQPKQGTPPPSFISKLALPPPSSPTPHLNQRSSKRAATARRPPGPPPAGRLPPPPLPPQFEDAVPLLHA